jgi:hypothetical protein
MAKRTNNTGGRRPGGGIGSRVNVEKSVRVGQRAEEIRHQGVAQIGSSLGDHATDHRHSLGKSIEPVRGSLRPAGSPGSVPLNVGCGGPGTGRDVQRSGTQASMAAPILASQRRELTNPYSQASA